MKRIYLLALILGVSACGGDHNSPAAPTAVLRAGGSSTAAAASRTPLGINAAPVPYHILHPVDFPMSVGVVAFPPRNEPNIFFQDLQGIYRDVLGRSQTAPSFVDPEGENVWLTEYFRFYLNGCAHSEAMSRTLTEITTGSSLPTCGAEVTAFPSRDLPNEFQGRLEATYRDVLRRPQTLSFVDSEGANVWLAQYLRFRVSGCGHADAENKVFTEIRGGGVQPDCSSSSTSVFNFQGSWGGTNRIGSCSDSGDLRTAGGCTIFSVGTVGPLGIALRQSGSSVNGAVAEGSVTGIVNGGIVRGSRLTGLTGTLTSSTTVLTTITGWDTSASGNNMVGDIIQVLTIPGATGSIVLDLQLQGVTRISTQFEVVNFAQPTTSQAFEVLASRLEASFRRLGH